MKMAADYRREERMLSQFEILLREMREEMRYRLTPLPRLLRRLSEQTDGVLGKICIELACEMEQQCLPDADSCMVAVLTSHKNLPGSVTELLRQMGASLGLFDLQGQLCELEAVQTKNQQKLASLRLDRDKRIRNYQTLGLCAGSALAILLL